MNSQLIINVKINKKDDLFNRYNDNNIDDRLISYILNQCKGENVNNQIIINLLTKVHFDDEEKENIRNTFIMSFNIINYDEELQRKENQNKSIFLLVVGIICIFISYFLDVERVLVFGEMIRIIGWVAIWELTDYLLFTSTQVNLKRKRVKQLNKAIINFLEDKDA